MRTLTLVASVLISTSIAFAVINTPEIMLDHPFERRGESTEPGTHMLKLVLSNDHFRSLAETMSVQVPTQVNKIRIPDLEGDAPGYLSGTSYAFTNVSLSHSCMNSNSIVKLGTNSIDFNMDLDLDVEADYKLTTTNRAFQKGYEGKMQIRLRRASVTGNLTMTRNAKGGIAMHIDHIESDIQKMTVKMDDISWVDWIGTLLNYSGKPILTTAIGAVVGNSVPPLVNNLLAYTASQNMIMSDGRRVETWMEVVEEPVITSDSLTLEMDLRTQYIDW